MKFQEKISLEKNDDFFSFKFVILYPARILWIVDIYEKHLAQSLAHSKCSVNVGYNSYQRELLV